MCIAVEETNIESILVFVLLTESLVHNNVNCFSSFHTYTARKGRGTYVIESILMLVLLTESLGI